QVETLNFECLVRKRKPYRPVIVKFYLFDLGIKIGEVADEPEPSRIAQRPRERQIAGHGGVPGYMAMQIRLQERIGVEAGEMEVNMRRPELTQPDVALDQQLGILEIGLAGQRQVCAVGD